VILYLSIKVYFILCISAGFPTIVFFSTMIILLRKLIMVWFQNRGTALTILQEMEGVAGDIRRSRRGQEDGRNMEPFLRRGQCGDRRS
jgi:hypothetical protein